MRNSLGFFHTDPCRHSKILKKLMGNPEKTTIFLSLRAILHFFVCIVNNGKYNVSISNIRIGLASSLGHLKNATISLSFLAKIVLSY